MSKSKSWLKDASIYNLMIDRFARGNGEEWLNTDATKPVFCGGDLNGVINKLDYLQDLGINTILLTPFHRTSAYHGYHILDLFSVDERFGDLETIKRLIHEVHKRGMHVLMDFVMGHISSQHPYFIDARAHPDSRYRNWFLFEDWPDKYQSFLNYYELPKLNLANREVKDHVIAAARYWLDLGFDGLRLDHVVGISHSFLHEIHQAVHEGHPHAVLIGEAVQGKFLWRDLKTLRLRHKFFLYLMGRFNLNTTFFVQLQYRHLMDGVLDFFFRDMVMNFMLQNAWYKPLWLLKLILWLHSACYPKSFSLITLLDNADDDRFTYFLKGDLQKYKKILSFQFSRKQPTLIYYGNEAGVQQTESRQYKVYGDRPHGDLVSRGLMKWKNINRDLHDFFKAALQARKRN